MTRIRRGSRLTIILACLFYIIPPQVADASTTSQGYVTGVVPTAGGAVFFYVDGTRSTPPGCASGQPRWTIDATTTAGQAMTAAILTAFSAHQHITVFGTSSCDTSSDSENVAFFLIEH